MKIELKDNHILVIREKGDRGFFDGSWGSGESNLLYKVKQWLNDNNILGCSDWIKKRMHKDGCLVSEEQIYVRTRKPIKVDGKKQYVCFYNDHYAITGLNRDFNNGKAKIRMHKEGKD